MTKTCAKESGPVSPFELQGPDNLYRLSPILVETETNITF